MRNTTSPYLAKSRVLFILFALFIISPKIDIVAVGDSGLRIEDIIFFIALPLALAGRSWRSIPISKTLNAYGVYMLFCFISTTLNISDGGVYGYLFFARQLQYAAWYFIGLEIAEGIGKDDLRSLCNILGLILLLWAAGEISGMIPKTGKFSGAENRISVNTTGPYEIAVLATQLLLFASNSFSKISLAIILVATQARITLGAALIVYAKNRPQNAIVLAILFIFVAWLYATYNYDFISSSRISESYTFFQSLDVLLRSWNTAWVIENINEYFVTTYDNISNILVMDGDLSFEIRSIRWAFVLKATMFSGVFHLLFGWGCGAWGFAVDSNFIRVFGESGIIGLTGFVRFLFVSLKSKNAWSEIRNMTMIIAITALFIDIAVASKVMTFFWTILGLCDGERRFRQLRAPI